MLHEFITTNRTELVNRCRHRGAKRYQPMSDAGAAEYGVPLFLDQLVNTLRSEQSTDVRSALAPGQPSDPSEIGRAAALRGAELRRRGYSIDQVVHEYGNICQAVTELAIEGATSISTDEFRTLNRCLDDAIADAVSSYALAGEVPVADPARELHARLDFLQEEHRRLTDIATGAFSAIRAGNVGAAGATGFLLAHALSELSGLVERVVPQIRAAAASD